MLAINPGNYSDGTGRTDIRPMDWAYTFNFLDALGTWMSQPGGCTWLFVQNKIKSFHENTYTNNTVSRTSGWAPGNGPDIARFAYTTTRNFLSASPVSWANKTAVMGYFADYWMDQNDRFTVAQFRSALVGDDAAFFPGPTYVLPQYPMESGTLPERCSILGWWLHDFCGVPQTKGDRVLAWGRACWPVAGL